MSEIITVTNKTPIEIALQVDEDGYTTSSALHNFLDGNPKNYAKFCRDNIIENEFAIEGEDYFVVESGLEMTENGGSVPKYDTHGRVKQEYKISASLAKKISMKTKTPRGEEARQYFLGCETGLVRASKVITKLEAVVKEQGRAIEFLKKELGAINDKCDLTLSDANHAKKIAQYLEGRVPIWEGGRGIRPSKEAAISKDLLERTQEIMEILNEHSEISNEWGLKGTIGYFIEQTDKRSQYKFVDVKYEYKQAFGTDNDYALDMIAHSEEYTAAYLASIDFKLNRILEDDEMANIQSRKMEEVERRQRERQENEKYLKEKEREDRIRRQQEDEEKWEAKYQERKNNEGFGNNYLDKLLISAHETLVKKREAIAKSPDLAKPFNVAEFVNSLEREIEEDRKNGF